MPCNFIEQDVNVRGLRIRVKLWHPQAPRKIIALHGWLDNAASFDVLAPYFPDYAIAAIDLAGQGCSDHRPASANYHLWDDLLDILAVADELGWQAFALLGHSRGAMLSVMLAASCAERVSHLLLLDALMPAPVQAENAALQLRRYLGDYRQPHETRTFPEREQAIAVRARASAIPVSMVELLASRQLRQDVGQWFWAVDARLKAASAVKMTQVHNRAFLQAVQCPVQVILAARGLGADPLMAQLREEFPHFCWSMIDGHHHFHMDVQAEEIAHLCLKTLVS